VVDSYDPSITVDNSIISVNEKEYLEYIKPGKITSIISGSGVLVNIAYSLGEITYTIESEAEKVFAANN
jgi:hypothetical protein